MDFLKDISSEVAIAIITSIGIALFSFLKHSITQGARNLKSNSVLSKFFRFIYFDSAKPFKKIGLLRDRIGLLEYQYMVKAVLDDEEPEFYGYKFTNLRPTLFGKYVGQIVRVQDQYVEGLNFLEAYNQEDSWVFEMRFSNENKGQLEIGVFNSAEQGLNGNIIGYGLTHTGGQSTPMLLILSKHILPTDVSDLMNESPPLRNELFKKILSKSSSTKIKL